MSISLTSVFGGLITSGVQRAGTLVFQKALRTHKIDLALKGSAQKNPIIIQAINDFTTVIGSLYGEFDEPLANFLKELERTGIINNMMECALLGRNSPNNKILFQKLHNSFFKKGTGNSNELFDQILTSFTVTIGALFHDKSLAYLLKTIHSDLASRIDATEAAIGGINKSIASLPPAEQTDLILLKVAKGLQTSYRSIRIETNKGARLVEITKIYISPKLSYRQSSVNSARVKETATGLSKFLSKRKNKNHESNTMFGAADKIDVFTLNEMKTQFKRVVVLGDPGGGKSTLCQSICYDMAKQCVYSLSPASSADGNPQLQRMPFRIILRSFEKARLTSPQLTLFEFLIRDLMNYTNCAKDDLESAVSIALNTGKAVLAFDGLDEILNTGQRRQFVDLVAAFSEQYPLCPVIVTSRFVGYDTARLPDEFEELVLDKFDEQEVADYVKKFMSVVAGKTAKESIEQAVKFITQTGHNASDLRSNPLMLGLMTWIFNHRGDVPSNRPEIYRECAMLMFERWDSDRDINADIPHNFDLLQLFSNLASAIYGSPGLADGVDENWLETRTRDFFESVYEDSSQAFLAAKKLVKFVTNRAWVMCEKGDNLFAFTHQTFLEYFLARDIDDKTDSVKEVFDRLESRIKKGEWDVVVHLTLQIKTDRNMRRQDEALAYLRKLIKSVRPKAELAAVVSFAARSLSYLSGSEVAVRAVVDDILGYLLANSKTGKNSEVAVLTACLRGATERNALIRRTIEDGLVGAFKKDNTRSRSLSIIMPDDDEPYRTGHSLFRNTELVLPQETRDNIHSKLKNFVMERVGSSQEFARVAWQWYGHISEQLIRTHGIECYFLAVRYDCAVKTDALTSMVLGAGEYNKLFEKPAKAKAECIAALSMLGRVGYTMVPLAKFEPSLLSGFENPPFSVWSSLLRRIKNSATLLGALFAAQLFLDNRNTVKSSASARRGSGKKIDNSEVLTLQRQIEKSTRGLLAKSNKSATLQLASQVLLERKSIF